MRKTFENPKQMRKREETAVAASLWLAARFPGLPNTPSSPSRSSTAAPAQRSFFDFGVLARKAGKHGVAVRMFGEALARPMSDRGVMGTPREAFACFNLASSLAEVRHGLTSRASQKLSWPLVGVHGVLRVLYSCRPAMRRP